jgi:hypothetical protein
MSSVPKQRHFYGLNQLHYITTSTYRRARLFDSQRFKRVARTSAFEVRGFSMGYGKKPQTWKAQVCATRLQEPARGTEFPDHR